MKTFLLVLGIIVSMTLCVLGFIGVLCYYQRLSALPWALLGFTSFVCAVWCSLGIDGTKKSNKIQ